MWAKENGFQNGASSTERYFAVRGLSFPTDRLDLMDDRRSLVPKMSWIIPH